MCEILLKRVYLAYMSFNMERPSEAVRQVRPWPDQNSQHSIQFIYSSYHMLFKKQQTLLFQLDSRTKYKVVPTFLHG